MEKGIELAPGLNWVVRRRYTFDTDGNQSSVTDIPKSDNRRLAVKIWFDTGLRMNDGTPRTVAAISEIQRKEYLAKGWRIVDTTPMPVQSISAQPEIDIPRRGRKPKGE